MTPIAETTKINRAETYRHIFIIVLLGCLAYGNSLGGALQFDDDLLVRTDLGRDLFSIKELLGTTRWLTDLTFALNRFFHQEQVFGYHLCNLVIHLSTAVVIYLLFTRIIAALQSTLNMPDNNRIEFLRRYIPVASAALFVCHPIQTQAVSYIIQRYTSLATLLYLSSLLAFLQARLTLNHAAPRRTIRTWSAASFCLALLAMKSKEIAFTLPLLMIVCEYWLFDGQLLAKRNFIAVCTALLLVIPGQLLLSATAFPHGVIDRLAAASAETTAISRSDYLLTQCAVVATYLRMLFLPINQSVDYDYPVYHFLTALPVLGGLLLHLVLISSAIYLLRAAKRPVAATEPGNGVAMKVASLGIVWFYLTLSVESSVFPIRDVIFEHRLYLPSVGIFMTITAGIAGFAANRPKRQPLLWLGTALLCVVLTEATSRRNRVWTTELAMWQDVVAKAPGKSRGYHALGSIYFKKYLPDAALPYLIKAVELDSGVEKYWITLNDTVAIMRPLTGRCTDGRMYYSPRDGVIPSTANLWWAISYNNLGLAYEQQNNLTKAGEYFRKSIAVYPDMDLSWGNLALLCHRQHDTTGSAEALTHLHTINPHMAEAVTLLLRQPPR
jgi:tetratricopeptide (TPR) repeat protein